MGLWGRKNADCRSVLSAECISVIRSLTVSGDTVAFASQCQGESGRGGACSNGFQETGRCPVVRSCDVGPLLRGLVRAVRWQTVPTLR